MQKVICVCFAALIVTAWAAVAGGRSNLTPEELTGEGIQKHLQPGFDKIKENKEASNSLTNCIDYDKEITEGTKQVVAGFSYDLTFKIEPKKSTADNCGDETVDLTSVPTEFCKVNVWEKPGQNAEIVYTFQECTTSST